MPGKRDSRDPESVALSRAKLDEATLEIAERMARGTWHDSQREEIGQRYGVVAETVKHWAATAARYLRLSNGETLSALRARNVQRLDQAWDMAVNVEDGANVDIKAGVSALAEQNKLLGLIVQRHEVSGEVATSDYEALRARLATVLCEHCRAKVLEGA